MDFSIFSLSFFLKTNGDSLEKKNFAFFRKNFAVWNNFYLKFFTTIYKKIKFSKFFFFQFPCSFCTKSLNLIYIKNYIISKECNFFKKNSTIIILLDKIYKISISKIFLYKKNIKIFVFLKLPGKIKFRIVEFFNKILFKTDADSRIFRIQKNNVNLNFNYLSNCKNV